MNVSYSDIPKIGEGLNINLFGGPSIFFKMDLKCKSIAWVGNVYQKFEAMCLEVEDIMCQETAKYVEGQVQNVGASVKKFYSEVMQDLDPLSSEDEVKDGYVEGNVDMGTTRKYKIAIKESLNVLPIFDEPKTIAPAAKHSSPKWSDSADLCNSKVGPRKHCVPPAEVSAKEDLKPALHPAELSEKKNSTPLLPLAEISLKIDSSAALLPPEASVKIESQYALSIGQVHRKDVKSSPNPLTSHSKLSPLDKYDRSDIRNEDISVGGDMVAKLIVNSGNESFQTSSCSGHHNEKYQKINIEHSSNIATADGTNSDSAVTSSVNPLVVLCKKEVGDTQLFPARNIASMESDEGSHDDNSELKDDNNDPVKWIMENTGDTDSLKLEESCIFVDSKELYGIPRGASKDRSYKKKIRDAFALRMSFAKKEYEQLAVCYKNIDSQRKVESSASSLLRQEWDRKNLLNHDFRESDWELL